jgi:hypothetical protein
VTRSSTTPATRMKHRVLPVLVLLSSPVCCAAWGDNRGATALSSRTSTDGVYDAASFGAELRRLSDVLQHKPSANEIAKLRKSLPQSWNVSAPERTYSISTEPLRAQLGASSVEEAEAWIEHLQAEIEGSQRHGANLVAARSELDHILAGPEFAAVRPPSVWELLRQRISAWLERLLLKIFGGVARHPIGGDILFWLLLIGGVSFVALWVFRFLSKRDSMQSLRPASSVPTSRTWQQWIRAARQAANRGDFREAVHSAYWAGIARLEDIGAIPRDRTKTPREYLRLVPESYSTAGELHWTPREPLMTLTSRLERIWYANRGASSEDFLDSLRQLEALGCPLE